MHFLHITACRVGRVAAVLFAVGGCALFENDVVCTSQPRPALAVMVTDSVTGAVIGGAAVIARDGAYRDSVSSRSNGYAVLAQSRAGRYDIDVRAAGYREWHAIAVRVTTDDCGPVMVTVAARLRAE